MAGDSEAARMRVTVAVVEDEIRSLSQPRKSPQKYWNFTKTEQAGNVRERERCHRPLALDFFHLRVAIDDDAGDGLVAACVERYICPGYQPNVCETVNELDAFAQLGLNDRRLARSHHPGV